MLASFPTSDLVYSITYHSVTLLPFGAAGARGLLDMITVARRRNACLGLTGVLYSDGAYFVQTIEGARESVLETYARIAADPRHAQVTQVHGGPIGKRRFAHWAMALVSESSLQRALRDLGSPPDATRLDPDRFAGLMSSVLLRQSA